MDLRYHKTTCLKKLVLKRQQMTVSLQVVFVVSCFMSLTFSEFVEYNQSIKQYEFRSGPYFLKLFSCSTQLSTKFILLINVKMPTIVGILTFKSMINTTSERLNKRKFLICQYFSFYEQLKFRAQLS